MIEASLRASAPYRGLTHVAATAVGLVHVLVAMLALLATPAIALQPIVVSPEQERIEITTLGELYESRGDTLQVETAASTDGASGRISVRASTPGTNPNWIVFALTNGGDTAIERWLTADRYNIIGSGAVWPDLDARRIEAVTPSIGFVPERLKSDRADVFRITLEPGQTITYVAELSSERFARVYLWKPLDYELKVRERQLFNGVMLGLTGLLAIFLTSIFAANHKVIFPAAALVAWCVLGYLSVDFGFFHKLFQLRPEDNAVYRAALESAMAASLVIFFYLFLRIPLWNGLARMLFAVWIMAQLALIAVAIIDPRLASTFARVSFVVIGAVGGVATLFLAVRGQDRALSLIPTWLLFLVWIFGAGLTLSGRLSGDMVVSGLVAGLVLIVLLIGFTVTQFAFRSLEPLFGAAPSELQARSIAVDAAGAAVWEWSGRRDEIKVNSAVESTLGLNKGELCTRVDEFVQHLHSADRERFRLMLLSIQERGDGKVRSDFRIRHADNSYRWFELDAAAIPSSDGRSMKCAGLLRDVTDAKRAQERLLHDAIHCSLTGLPNRELFLDRLNAAIMRARTEPNIRPTLFFIDLDKFRGVNLSFGLVVGDSLLLTVARRLQRHLGPQDSLARVGGDQFAILVLAEQSATELAALAERMRRSLRSPIKIAGQEVVLTGSLGIAIFDGSEQSHADLLKEAEIAMYRSKRSGADRIEIFRPEMRGDANDQLDVEAELRKAIEKDQLKFFYKPIVYLPTEELVGFEAIVRWEHPRQGLVNPSKLVGANSESDLAVKLGSQVLLRAARDCAAWQQELPRANEPLFVSVNISSPQLFRQDLIQEMRHSLGRNLVPKGSMRLEVAEHIVLENPERAAEILGWLRGAGAELALDEFGSGYSSFSYLHRFPFDTVKIGRAGLRGGWSGTDGSRAIVRSMVVLAHELGKKVVADGIETGEEVGFLRSIGCEFAQGHYFSEPVADKDVAQLLRLVRKSERKLQPRGFFRATAKKRLRGESSDASVGDPTIAVDAVSVAHQTPAASQIADAGSVPPAAVVANGKTAAAPMSMTKTFRSRPRQQQPSAGGNGVQAPDQTAPSRPMHVNGTGTGQPQVMPLPPTPFLPQRREQPPAMSPSLGVLNSISQPTMSQHDTHPTMMPPLAGVPPTPLNAHPIPPLLHAAPPPLVPAYQPPRTAGAMQSPAVWTPLPPPSPSIPTTVNGNGSQPPGPPTVPSPVRPTPDFSTLPPSIAQSLSRLAGGAAPRMHTELVKNASVARDKRLPKTR